MFPIKLIARLCRIRLWGAAAVAVTMAAAAPAIARTSHVSLCSPQHVAKLSAAQKRACARHVAAAKPTAGKAKRVRASRREPVAEVRRIPVKRIVYRHGHKRILTSYRVVNFSPEHLAPRRGYSLHETPDALSLRSSEALVIDKANSEVLFDKNSRSVVPIASISKLMTAMVALDSNIPLSKVIEVTDADRDYEKGTGSRLSVGSRLSREDMLHIALMSSENRAAAALSRDYPGGRPAFLAAMNRKARELGMTDTHFNDPTGLSSQNVSTARDLVKMVEAAAQYPMIRRFSTDTEYNVDTGKRILHYVSTNHLIGHPGWEIHLQKTGFINEAGQCLVMDAEVEGRPVIMVLLDSTGRYSRFADATRVRNWLQAGGFDQRRGTSTAQQATGGEQHAAL